MKSIFEKSCAVEVRQVENGFMVSIPFNLSHDYRNAEDMVVFENRDSLLDWLRNHFVNQYGALTEKQDG